MLRRVERDVKRLPRVVERERGNAAELDGHGVNVQRPPDIVGADSDQRPVEIDVHAARRALPDASVMGPVPDLEVEDETTVSERLENDLRLGQPVDRDEDVEVGRDPVLPLEPASELGALEDDDGDAGGGERSEHLRRGGFDEEGANGGANAASRLARVVALARGSVHPPHERNPAAARRRILIVHASADLYGSDRACLAIAASAVNAGLNVHVVVPWAGPLVEPLKNAGATVHLLDPLVLRRSDLRGLRAVTAPLRWTRALVGLHRFSRAHRFDLVHSNCVTTIGGSYLARRWRAPHVWHVHELFADDGLSRHLFERLLRRADRVVAASAAVGAQFRSPATRAKCVIAPTGADVPRGVPTTTPLERPVATLICVGRLNAWKGQDDLIEAVALLRARGVDVELDVVGEVFAREHQFRDRLVALAHDRGLEKHVAFLGERTDALELVGRADIAVVPSALPEPFGMVVVEAMALGRPVIATDAGGPREIISDGRDGILVPPRNPQALADAIARLVGTLCSPDGSALPRARRPEGFTSTEMARRVVEMHRDLLTTR